MVQFYHLYLTSETPFDRSSGLCTCWWHQSQNECQTPPHNSIKTAQRKPNNDKQPLSTMVDNIWMPWEMHVKDYEWKLHKQVRNGQLQQRTSLNKIRTMNGKKSTKGSRPNNPFIIALPWKSQRMAMKEGSMQKRQRKRVGKWQEKGGELKAHSAILNAHQTTKINSHIRDMF